MSQHKLDQAIAEIRNEAVDDAVLRGSAKRVFARLFDSTLVSDRVDRIRGCADFRLLMKSYLNHTLSPARALLLEAHTLQCVSCPQALQRARPGAPQAELFETGRVTKTNKAWPVLAWALAASLAIGIGIGVVGGRNRLLPWQHVVPA